MCVDRPNVHNIDDTFGLGRGGSSRDLARRTVPCIS